MSGEAAEATAGAGWAAADELIGEVGFQITPLATCPHLASSAASPPPPLPAALAAAGAGSDAFAPLPCGVRGCGYGAGTGAGEAEVWLCASCGAVGCCRAPAGGGHAAAHGAGAGGAHALALSCADLSAWCYACDAYISVFAPELQPLYAALHERKFGVRPALPPAPTLSLAAAAPSGGGGGAH